MQPHTDPIHQEPPAASAPPERPGSLTGPAVCALAVCALAVLASGWVVGSGLAGLPVLAGLALLAALVVDSPPAPNRAHETGSARRPDGGPFSVGR